MVLHTIFNSWTPRDSLSEHLGPRGAVLVPLRQHRLGVRERHRRAADAEATLGRGRLRREILPGRQRAIEVEERRHVQHQRERDLRA